MFLMCARRSIITLLFVNNDKNSAGCFKKQNCFKVTSEITEPRIHAKYGTNLRNGADRARTETISMSMAVLQQTQNDPYQTKTHI